MMVVSARVSKRKLLTGIFIAAAVILLLVILCRKAEAQPSAPTEETVSSHASTNEQRISFLQSFGWEISEVPTETQEVRIPETFNDVFDRYNRLQQSQGYDLAPYSGKTVKRYVYEVNNHPDGPEHFATLLVYKDKIIGGDITGTGQGGTMHGFQSNSVTPNRLQ